MKNLNTRLVFLSMVLGLSGAVASAQNLGTSFTYQGRLVNNGDPASGAYDITFVLHSHPTNSAPVGSPVALTRVPVMDGFFTVHLDFGDIAFNGQPRWLEIEVETTTLAPRQPIRPAPYALALPAMRIVQHPSGHNVVGGSTANNIGTGVFGGTIAGGGEPTTPNSVLGPFGTVGGGRGNVAGHPGSSAAHAVAAGGEGNTASNVWSVVSGGLQNTASGGSSTVGGGQSNWASGDYATIGGGIANEAGAAAFIGGGGDNIASGLASTVPGGTMNRAQGAYSFAAGRRAKALHNGTFVWADSQDADFASTINNQFLIRASGGVGIGTVATVPFQLVVNGTAAKPGGGSWSAFSDARLKRDIQQLQPGTLDQLLALRGYVFEYENDAIENRLALPGVQTGLIAQEVAEVFPDWVGEDDEGYLYITERGTTAIFVEALRELRAEKDAEIASLRAYNEELEQRLARLEAILLNQANAQNGGAR